jgi:hypothetical protein
MIDTDVDDGPLLPADPARKPDRLLTERVRTLSYATIRARRGPVSTRAIDAGLSVLVAGTAVLYLGWALTFASALYQ